MKNKKNETEKKITKEKTQQNPTKQNDPTHPKNHTPQW